MEGSFRFCDVENTVRCSSEPGVLGTDEEVEDVGGSVSVTRREKVGHTEDIGDKATLKHLCYLIVHGTA